MRAEYQIGIDGQYRFGIKMRDDRKIFEQPIRIDRLLPSPRHVGGLSLRAVGPAPDDTPDRHLDRAQDQCRRSAPVMVSGEHDSRENRGDAANRNSRRSYARSRKAHPRSPRRQERAAQGGQPVRTGVPLALKVTPMSPCGGDTHVT